MSREEVREEEIGLILNLLEAAAEQRLDRGGYMPEKVFLMVPYSIGERAKQASYENLVCTTLFVEFGVVLYDVEESKANNYIPDDFNLIGVVADNGNGKYEYA